MRSDRWPASRRRGEACRLQHEHRNAHPERRIAELVGEVDRNERQQRVLRHRAERRAGRSAAQRQRLRASSCTPGDSTAQASAARSLRRANVAVRVAAAGERNVPRNARIRNAITRPGTTFITTISRQLNAASSAPTTMRRERVAGIAAHAVQRQHEPLALRKALRERRDRRRMPQVVADADQRHAQKQRPVAVREAHQQIRHADPEQRQPPSAGPCARPCRRACRRARSTPRPRCTGRS